MGETPEPLLKQEATSQPGRGKEKRRRMEGKSSPTTHRLWLHPWQLADYAVVYSGIVKR